MKYFLAIILLVISMQGAAQTENRQPSLVCMQLIQIVDSAFSHKSQGKTKQQMLAPLPSKDVLAGYPKSMSAQRLLGEQMLEVVADIYSHEALPKVAYSAYRAESCHRSTTGQPVVKDFAKVTAQLSQCGSLEKEAQYKCGFELAKPVL
ncbi:hypothetical protein [Pseudoalteromonas sp. R3]|uniref:hypothetical protein n=1 Tax=Pseudoalteromonas sp. R3 TaxID=1709477 RepID=UPI0006B5049B|nr:hypothetical protein [Pseudoalteromonas sp. R3]AZZ96470.1 hypothetical protein ELR70_04640 [Pseudoalteromonas sp. R3]